eukprot:359116-Chlamydomonas_euryale.AAC.5
MCCSKIWVSHAVAVPVTLNFPDSITSTCGGNVTLYFWHAHMLHRACRIQFTAMLVHPCCSSISCRQCPSAVACGSSSQLRFALYSTTAISPKKTTPAISEEYFCLCALQRAGGCPLPALRFLRAAPAGALRLQGRPSETRQHVYVGHAVPRLRRPSPSLLCTGDHRHYRPAAAGARQRPQRLPAPGHRHGQAAEWHPAPDGSNVCSGGGAPADARPQPSVTHTPGPHS